MKTQIFHWPCTSLNTSRRNAVVWEPKEAIHLRLPRDKLRGNKTSDISPLVANSGLSAGDTVNLKFSPLSTTSGNVYIPQLKDRESILNSKDKIKVVRKDYEVL